MKSPLEEKFKKPVDQMSPEEYVSFEEYLSEYGGEDRVISSIDLSKETGGDQDFTYTMKSGIPSLDRMCDGFEGGELIIVTGKTGEGKTTALFQITRNLEQTDAKPLWFSYEMTHRQLMKKMGIDIFEFFMPRVMTSNHLDFIEKKIMEANVKYGTRVVFIDHLSMLYSMDKFSMRNVSLELGDVVAKIKNMALRHNVVIFLVSHVRKMDRGVEVSIDEIRDSGHTANLADIVITVQRVTNDYKIDDRRMKPVEEDDNRIKIKVEKNRRNGTRGSFLAEYNKGIITELAEVLYKPSAMAQKRLDDFWPED